MAMQESFEFEAWFSPTSMVRVKVRDSGGMFEVSWLAPEPGRIMTSLMTKYLFFPKEDAEKLGRFLLGEAS